MGKDVYYFRMLFGRDILGRGCTSSLTSSTNRDSNMLLTYWGSCRELIWGELCFMGLQSWLTLPTISVCPQKLYFATTSRATSSTWHCIFSLCCSSHLSLTWGFGVYRVLRPWMNCKASWRLYGHYCAFCRCKARVSHSLWKVGKVLSIKTVLKVSVRKLILEFKL